MNLWIDDIRPAPDGYDAWATNYYEAVSCLLTGRVTHVSFDHDLGIERTGYDIANWIEYYASVGQRLVRSWEIHSANPVGRENIKRAMTSADRLLAHHSA